MQRKTILAEPFRQDLQHAAGVRFTGEAHDQIVRVTHQKSAAPQPWLYHLLEPLREALDGAPLAATRRVTDKGWMPHSRQVGITGHYIAPRLYIAVGLSGRFNHMVGVRKAATVLAINADPEALVFDHCDVGIVGDWRTVVPELVQALGARQLESATVGD